jgi:hypothetical protein
VRSQNGVRVELRAGVLPVAKQTAGPASSFVMDDRELAAAAQECAAQTPNPRLTIGAVEMPYEALACAICHYYLYPLGNDIWEHRAPGWAGALQCINVGKRFRVPKSQLAAEEL